MPGDIPDNQVSQAASVPEIGTTSAQTGTAQFSGLVATNIDVLAKRWKLQRRYLWEVILPDVDGLPGIDVSQYCQDVKFGEYKMEDVAKMRYGAFQKGYAGFFAIDTVSISFLCPIPDLVGEYLRSWKSLIIDERGFYYPKIQYAKVVYVRLYDRDGTISGSFRLAGVFPKTFPAYDLSYEGEDLVKFDIDFNVDRIYVDV
jgi:hypothetical protein